MLTRNEDTQGKYTRRPNTNCVYLHIKKFPEGARTRDGVNPRLLYRRNRASIKNRRAKMEGNTPQSTGPGVNRRSVKNIRMNIVQRRTQMFEQGIVEDDSDVSSEIKEPITIDVKSPGIKPEKPAVPPNRPPISPRKFAKKSSQDLPPDFNSQAADRVSGNANPPPEENKPVSARMKIFESQRSCEGSPTLQVNGSPKRDRRSSSDKPLPKPVRPPKPNLPDIQKENVSKAKQTVEQKVIPAYSKVNKIVKKEPAASGAGSTALEQDPSAALCDIPTSPTDGRPGPPLKPPRTFAHDAYLQKKALKKKRRTSCPSPVEEFVNNDLYESNNMYEEIEERQKIKSSNRKISAPAHMLHQYEEITDNKKTATGSNKSRSSECSDSYEEIAEMENQAGRLPKPSEHNAPIPSKRVLERPSDRPKHPPPPRPPQPSRWEDPKVRVNKHNGQLDSDSFVKFGTIRNPGYMKKHEHIPIKTFIDSSGTLKRYKSDECLYAEPTCLYPVSPTPFSHEDPIYQDPIDVVRPRGKSHVTVHGVVLDEENYAIPHRNKRSFNRSVREKVSRAYSVLRRKISDPSADSTPSETTINEDDNESEVDLEEHRRRLRHVTSVKEIYAPTSILKKTLREHPYGQLFDYAMIVGLEQEANSGYKANLLFSFPPENCQDSNMIIQFCFPDAGIWRPVSQYKSECYSFVLTKADGSQQFGFCRRFLSPGYGNRLPEVICVVSPLQANRFYGKLLQHVEEKRLEGMEQAQCLFKAAYARPLPSRGREAWIPCLTKDMQKDTICLERGTDERAENVSFQNLLKHLSVSNLLQVYASILLERRVIFSARCLGTLSSCIQAIMSLLYPFTWPHTFIPVLPEAMIEICCSPIPYIIGILNASMSQLRTLDMDEVMIVDLDSNELQHCLGDEGTIIPKKLQKCLVSALKDEPDESTNFDAMVQEAFLRMYVEIVGHYEDCISTQQDSKPVFQKDLFVRAVSSKSIRMFLEWFCETQLFEVFITERLENGISESSLFEQSIVDYRVEMGDGRFRANVKKVGKKMINFVVESGGKLKKAFAGSNVYV